MSKVIASPDITILDFSVLIDLSLAAPVASVTNLSTVVNPSSLQWIFEFYSPAGTSLYVGSFTTPDVDGVAFTTFTFPNPIQQTFGQVEYSSINQYTVKVSVKDSLDNILDLTKGNSLCKANGNTGKNNFGAALVDIAVKCGQASLLVTDQTNLLYKSLIGTKVSTSLEVTYPKDANGNTLAPFSVNTIPALAPLKYEGEGHEVYVVHIFDYDLGDFFYVRIRYSFTKVFAVWCNVTLEPLFCEVDRLTSIFEKDCSDTVESRNNQKDLTLVNGKLLKAAIGILQPLSNFDVPSIVDEVKSILGITCDCCRPAGISSIGTALATDAVFTVNTTCGDISATFANDGSGNIVLSIANKIYTFAMSDDPLSSAAFEYIPTQTGGCTKLTTLFVDRLALATEMLTEIQNSQTLTNILNAIVQRAQLSCSGLDGGAAFNLSTCDYSLEIGTLPAGKTFVSITINGVIHVAPNGTLITDASAIQTFLNSLALGTFVVVYTSGTNKTTITSAANTNVLATVNTNSSTGSQVIAFNNNCGLLCNLLQRIFDYLNELNLVQIQSGQNLSVCRFNPIDGTVLTQNFISTDKSSVVVKSMADSFCNIVNYIKDKLVTCDNIKNIFADVVPTTGIPIFSDYVIGSQNGKCQKMPLKSIALSIFNMVGSDADVKNAYCSTAKCDNITNCSPVTGLTSSVGDTTATFNWSSVVGAIGYKWSKDGVNWFLVTPTSAMVSGLTVSTAYTFRVYPVYAAGDGSSCTVTQAFTTTNVGAGCAAPGSLVLDNVTPSSFRASWAAVTGASGYRYRVNGGSWITLGSVLTVNVVGLAATTVYNFEIAAIIGGVPCVTTSTASTTTSTAVYSTSVGYSNISADVCSASPVTVYSSSPFGGGTTVYLDAALTTLLTGYTFIITAPGGYTIYALNTTTGVIGSPTGGTCVGS